MKRKYALISGGILVLASTLSAFMFFNKEKNIAPVYGTYWIYSNDPEIQRFIQGQNTFINLNKDHTIAYNTTINGKPKFNFSGVYTLDEKSNTLTIAWLGGKLPKQLKVEKEGEEYIIRIGETTYKKRRADH